jgi:hypothetical protein
MVPRKLLNVAENLHRQSAGRVVCFRHFLGPLSDLDVQCWRVVAHYTSEVCSSCCWPERRSAPSLRPHRDFPRLVSVEHVVLRPAHLRLQ